MRMRTPRPSSIGQVCVIDGEEIHPTNAVNCFSREHEHIPNPEWYITEDGVEFKVGDRLYDYYDCKWGVVTEEPRMPDGWFKFQHEGSTYSTSLNSVRVASKEPRR